MNQYHQLVSVNHQGVVIVFGRPLPAPNSDIFYNILSSDEDATDLNWEGFTKLEFTTQVRQVGMSLITLDTSSSTMAPTSTPFRVVTDQKYISVIQQSKSGTLYINRFNLVKTKSGTDQKQTVSSLSPAWEVRYSRSEKEDIPADKSDTQTYLTPDNKPFLEPSLELAMIDAVSEGTFDVVLLPVSGSDLFAWQFFTLDKNTDQISLYNFPATSNGLFDVSGKTTGKDYRILPDTSFAITDGKEKLAITSSPRAVVYTKHENVLQADGKTIGVKRASRVMMAVPGTIGTTSVTATVDSAVGTGGTIARLSGTLAASAIFPAKFDLLFDGVGSLTLKYTGTGKNPLEIKGAYTMEFLLLPGVLKNDAMIIGGTGAGDPKTLAPYAKMVDGGKLQVGFGDGTKEINCATQNQVFSTDSWTAVKVDYARKGTDPFTITVNGTVVPVTPCTASAEPSGKAVDTIGNQTNGFIGSMNSILITVGGTKIVDLPCDTVDYSVVPPTTPNNAASIAAEVHGPKLEPSSSPVNTNMSGTFYIDGMGLTYYAGIADFIKPLSAACLMGGSDGLLHLYYQGKDNRFSVAQFSTLSARATFYTEWKAEKSAENQQKGYLNFQAQRVGTYMNDCSIVVSPSAVSDSLCDITVTGSNNIGEETWKGLPRSIKKLAQIWNGAGEINPDNQGVTAGTTTFFDYNETAPSVITANTASESGGYFQFVSVPSLPLNIGSVEVTGGAGSGVVSLEIESTAPPAWNGKTIVHKWPDVLASPLAAVEILAGKSTSYDYKKVETPGTKAYGILAATGRSDEQVSNISVFVQDTLADFSMSIKNGSSPGECNVTVCGKKLMEVPRDQNSFARILNGEDKSYQYPGGYLTDITTKIYAVTNGLTASVLNSEIKPADISGALPYARLLRLIYTGEQYDQGYMSPIPKTAAKTVQGAKLVFNNVETPLTRSLLFSVLPASSPTNGATGKIQDTSSLTGGKAGILEHGVNGGWMQQNPKFCLGMNEGSKNYVSYNVEKTFSPSDKLAISSDLTLQTWINQDLSVNNAASRVLTYNVTGNKNNPDLPIQYMAGSTQGPGLVLKNGTFVRSSYNFTPPNLTLQIYVKPTSSKYTGTIFTISEVMGSREFLNLSLDMSGRPTLNFMSGAGSIAGASPLKKDRFTCITVTVADAGNGKVTLSLYNNAGDPQTAVAANTFTGKLGALKIGTSMSQDLEMTVNGASFWQRALSVTEVQNSYHYGFQDNDQDLGIRWNFTEGLGTLVMNSAATGSEFDSQVTNPASPAWDPSGAFFVPYMGRIDYVLQSNRILKGWTHLALASKQGYALKLDGINSGKVSDGDPFKPGSSFAVEAWIKPDSLTKKQVILEKPGSYILYTNTLGYLCLSVAITQEGEYYYSDPVKFDYEIKSAIAAGKTSYIAVNFTSGSKQDAQGSKEFESQKYYIYTSLYINGEHILDKNTDNYEKSVAVDQKTSSFYVGVGGDATFNWTGLLSNIRVWGRTLNETEIRDTAKLHLPPENRNGLVAAWNFDENTGTIAKDLTGKNNLQLTSNKLWTIWQDVAYANLYVNGRQSVVSRLTPGDVGGYNDTQFTVGGTLKSSALTSPYSGEIDDIRLFSTLLTEKQIYESKNSPLVGNEDNLAGYWKIDGGSGLTVYDLTGRGNNGTLTPASTPPTWKPSKAPLSNESASVINVLGGLDSVFIAQINGEPSVVEYGSTEKDAYGNIIGVMKRGYFYLSSSGNTVLEAQYKVGDLDTIYIGQVQSKPSVVGFIEGGPPLPSENQTLPYWTRPTSPTSEYDTACSVTYQESETKAWSFSGAQSSTFESSFNLKGGFYQKSKTETSVGIGAEAQTMVLEDKITLGAKGTISGKLGGTDGVTQSHGNTISLFNTFTPAGTWEPGDNILNMDVGRRYIQNNIGIAIVKSATADLYMLALKGTLTPVTYSLVPNTTIPVDTNIIEFPIDSKYIKNGTLDGKIGLMNDPDYPNADHERGSYFKPVEAYAIKQKIEKEEEQLKAYYDQFSQDKYRVIGSLDAIKDKLKENTAYDFEKKLNKRSIFNNYVWSAGGGMHKEEHSVANSYSESYTGASSLTFALGVEFKMDLGTPFGGYYLEADIMLGNTWQMTATKSEAASNSFSLNCKIAPTSVLCAPIITKDPGSGEITCTGFGTIPSPGKVDEYRFMSFFLAPSNDNFTTLKTIIDQNWLANSTTASANAMREAVAAENGAWRILYRTTYVSRVPAPFQPVQTENVSPNVDIPANLESNSWIVSIIKQLISKESPTPLEIGTAVENVLGKNAGAPGILGTLIPWWSNFLKAAEEYGTKEFEELSTLREDILQYMINMYDSDKYLKK